jgi:hypothetical protein
MKASNLSQQARHVLSCGSDEIEVRRRGGYRSSALVGVRVRHVQVWLPVVRPARSDEIVPAPMVTALHEGLPWAGRGGGRTRLHRIELFWAEIVGQDA